MARDHVCIFERVNLGNLLKLARTEGLVALRPSHPNDIKLGGIEAVRKGEAVVDREKS